jgi:hypothetical protein
VIAWTLTGEPRPSSACFRVKPTIVAEYPSQETVEGDFRQSVR